MFLPSTFVSFHTSCSCSQCILFSVSVKQKLGFKMATRAAETSAGLTTSWVPLATAGPTYSPECASAIYLNPQNNASIGAFDPWYGQHVNTALRCQLPQQTTWWDQIDLAASTLWNLGPLACPNGYTTATTSSFNAYSTILACCPS